MSRPRHRAHPEHVGMEAAKLKEAHDNALKGGGSGCILRGGRPVMARGDRKHRCDVYSSTKSIGVTATIRIADASRSAARRAVKDETILRKWLESGAELVQVQE